MFSLNLSSNIPYLTNIHNVLISAIIKRKSYLKFQRTVRYFHLLVPDLKVSLFIAHRRVFKKDILSSFAIKFIHHFKRRMFQWNIYFNAKDIRSDSYRI